MTTTTPTPQLEGDSQRTARRVMLWGSRALSYLVYAYLVVVEIILFLGFFLLLFGANPSSSFTQWVYRSLDRAMEPFRGIFPPIELGTTSGNEVESVFETSVVFAMIVYGIVALIVHAFIMWLTSRLNRLEAEEETAQYAAELEARRVRAEQMANQTAGNVPAVEPIAPQQTPPATQAPPQG
jgi:uncharacterized protein YggT (Ycf19 family)